MGAIRTTENRRFVGWDRGRFRVPVRARSGDSVEFPSKPERIAACRQIPTVPHCRLLCRLGCKTPPRPQPPHRSPVCTENRPEPVKQRARTGFPIRFCADSLISHQFRRRERKLGFVNGGCEIMPPNLPLYIHLRQSGFSNNIAVEIKNNLPHSNRRLLVGGSFRREQPSK